MPVRHYLAGMQWKEAAGVLRAACVHQSEGECSEVLRRVGEELSGKTMLQLRSSPETDLPEGRIREIAEALQRDEPLQYILGFEWFGPLRIAVGPGVLIPRPETEELVHWIRQEYAGSENLRVLDAGTGSGCIALLLKHFFPTWEICAGDVSPVALDYTGRNASALGLDIKPFRLNLLDPGTFPAVRFDLMVSNPPYVTPAEGEEMDGRVLDHEPHLALFVSNNDPLQFYKALLDLAEKVLVPGGSLFLESGSVHAHEVADCMQRAGYHTELRKDMYGQPRMIRAVKAATRP